MASTDITNKNYIGLTGDKPIRFIASDADGTLATMQRRSLRMPLRRFVPESGIRVAIASGRAWNEMNDVIENCRVCAISCAPMALM